MKSPVYYVSDYNVIMIIMINIIMNTYLYFFEFRHRFLYSV